MANVENRDAAVVGANRGAVVKNRFNSLTPGWNITFSILLILVSLLALIPMALVFIVSFSSEASISFNGFSFFPSEWKMDG